MVFNEAAPISSAITDLNTATGTLLSSVAGTMISTIAPFGGIVFGIYMIALMMSYMRGAESDPVMDFMMKFFSWALVIGYGLNAEAYTNTVIPIVTGLGDSFLKMFGGGANTTAMDTLFLSISDLIDAASVALEESNATRVMPNVGGYFNLLLDSALLLTSVLPFMAAATVTVLVAKIGSQIVAAVGPLFFLALLFPATRQYFSSWLNTVLSYAFIPLLVAIVSMLGVGTTIGILDLQPGETILTVSFSKILFVAFINWVLLFVLYQVSSLASSLSSGGINAGMPSGGIGGIARAIKSGVSGSARDKQGIRSWNHQRLDDRHKRQNRKNSIKENRPKAG